MLPLMNTKKIVIIYLPNGKDIKFTTSEKIAYSDSTYKLVETVECDPGGVRIGSKKDDPAGEAYMGMPYIYQMFKD